MSLAIRLISMFRTVGVTWNPSDKASDITLSADLLSATRGPTGTGETHTCARSTSPQGSRKLYFEATGFGTITGTSQVNVGICSSAFTLAGSFAYPGALQEPDSIGVFFWNGNITRNNSTVATVGALTGGAVACYAVDIDNSLLWVRKNGGSWNGSGTADPATGVGGISFPVDLTGVPVYIVIDVIVNDGTGATLNGGLTPFTQTPPSGYVPWALA